MSFYYQEAARKGERLHRYIRDRMPEIHTVVPNRIFKAREKGFLVGGGEVKGKKGGVMSRKAVEVLLEHESSRSWKRRKANEREHRPPTRPTQAVEG